MHVHFTMYNGVYPHFHLESLCKCIEESEQHGYSIPWQLSLKNGIALKIQIASRPINLRGSVASVV